MARAGSPVSAGARLDSRIAFLMWLAARTGQSFRPELSVEAMRAAYLTMNRRFGFRDRGGVATRDLSIPTNEGAIAARLYRPLGAPALLPLLLYFHGGGFTLGGLDCYDHLTRFFAREGELAVLSVGYRLAPEHRFPRAHEDAFAALSYVQQAAAQLPRAPKIAVGGDSAGGNLAAVLSALATSRGLRRPDFQLLIYPPLDGRARFPSRRRYTADVPLTPAAIAWFSERFLSGEEDRHSLYLSPLDAPAPEALPPTYLLAAQFDPLVDEGRAYAERLRDAGVPVTYDLRPTLPHALVNLGGFVPEARRALREAIAVTAAALKASP